MRELWVPLSGAIAQQRNVDTIANNIANANTPGFKKDSVTFQEYLTALDKGHDEIDLPQKEWKPSDFYRSFGAEHSFVKASANYTAFDQGPLTPTNNPLDMAINGNGFFEVQTPNGTRYTRKGTFTVNNEGFIVTEQGFPLLSQIQPKAVTEGDVAQQDLAQQPIPLPQDRKISVGNNPQGAISVNQEGDIFIGNSKISTISVREFNDVNALRKEGNSLFINGDPANLAAKIQNSKVHQGFIEGSNVNAVQEMSELIRANRQFESIQRVIKAYDTISSKGVNEIAKF